MDRITYKHEKPNVKVFLGGHLVGQICPTKGGFQYVPNAGIRYAGTVFPTFAEVQRDIEGDD